MRGNLLKRGLPEVRYLYVEQQDQLAWVILVNCYVNVDRHSMKENRTQNT